MALWLDDPGNVENCETYQNVDAGHGRLETRKALISHDVAWLDERHHWPGLRAIGKVVATREVGDKTSCQTRYFLISAPLSPERFLSITRAHWSIENSLHWVLDVSMNEDAARNRKDNGPENLSILRRIALNLAPLRTVKRINARKAETRRMAGYIHARTHQNRDQISKAIALGCWWLLEHNHDHRFGQLKRPKCFGEL